MVYSLNPESMYMMPIHFGPMCGPRQGPGGKKFAFNPDMRKITHLSVSFLTNANQLQKILPPGFELSGDPVVTVFETFMKEIDWLAGRGYNVLGVEFPVVYNGTKDRATGPFLTVLWENLTDPILTGREQLGFSKIYCDLPEPNIFKGEVHTSASWMGFRFLDLKLNNLEQITPIEDHSQNNESEEKLLRGRIHYKYMPRTGDWGKADSEYAVLSPETENPSPPEKLFNATGEVNFHKARWEDLPTQHMIVNTLHELEIIEYRGARMENRIGSGDLGDQRILI